MAGDCLNLHSLINNEIKNYFIHEFPFVCFFPVNCLFMFCHFFPCWFVFSVYLEEFCLCSGY